MELFKVNSCSEDGIDLVSESQLESLLNRIKDSAEIMIRWNEEDDNGEEKRCSKILLTDNLMARIKDGRFNLTSTKEIEED